MASQHFMNLKKLTIRKVDTGNWKTIERHLEEASVNDERIIMISTGSAIKPIDVVKTIPGMISRVQKKTKAPFAYYFHIPMPGDAMKNKFIIFTQESDCVIDIAKDCSNSLFIEVFFNGGPWTLGFSTFLTGLNHTRYDQPFRSMAKSLKGKLALHLIEGSSEDIKELIRATKTEHYKILDSNMYLYPTAFQSMLIFMTETVEDENGKSFHIECTKMEDHLKIVIV